MMMLVNKQVHNIELNMFMLTVTCIGYSCVRPITAHEMLAFSLFLDYQLFNVPLLLALNLLKKFSYLVVSLVSL